MAPADTTPWLLRSRDLLFHLKEGRHLIGRSLDAEIPIDDALISRRHAELEVTRQSVTIRDLGARNGLYLSKRKLEKGEVVEMKERDDLILGSTRLVLMRERDRGRYETIDASPGQRARTVNVRPGATGSSRPYETFVAEADRASEAGDLERLAVATGMALDAVGRAIGGGLPTNVPAARSAVDHALQLAAQVGPEWLGRVFTFYAISGMEIPVDVLFRIQGFPPEARRASTQQLDEYLARITPELSRRGARGRALLRELLALREG